MATKAVDLPTFVLRHLDDLARSEGLTNYTIEHKAGSKNGDGFMSNMLAITLVEPSTSKRLALICKLQLANPESNDELDATAFFEREVEMYKNVFPLLASLQKQHGIARENGFFAYPKCYLAELSDNNESIIILEDLRAKNFVLWEKMVPLRFENVELLIKQLGRYHALSFVLRDQQPQVLTKFEAFHDVMVDLFIDTQVMRDVYDSSNQNAIRLLDEEKDKELVRTFGRDWPELNYSRQSADRLKRFGVLSHGDCHMNNMMFTVNNGIPDDIAIIDWQASAVISPASDVSNFILWCTEKPLRDQHFDELLHIYHAELTRTIAACGSDPSALFSYDDFLDQMREFGYNALAMSPMAVAFAITPQENMKPMSEVAANADSDDANAKMLAPISADIEQKFKQRLLDIFTDARRFGYSREQ